MKLRFDDIDNNFSTTLSSAITAATTSIAIESVPSNTTEGFLVIDEETDAKREYIYFSSKGASSVTCPASDGRGQCGTSATSHDAGASVKMVALREMLKPLRDAVFTGWLELNHTATYASASTITIPTDLTTVFTAGRKLKLTFASSGVKYFKVVSSSYGAPNTTVTLSGDTVLNEVINSIEMDNSPVGYAGNSPSLTDYSNLNAPEGFLINGKIVPTDAAGLTVAIKGMDGNDPSATNPVYCRINGVIRSITAALSVAKADGTNWFNAGSAELATKEIDYFVYLGYNATDGVVIGFSRIPSANSYDDFSATSTNEKYCAISTITNAAATDYYHVIGRFAATLSAGAGYTWTVPTYTAKNLIQRPIYETRWSAATSTLTGFSSVTGSTLSYKIDGDRMLIKGATLGGTSNATTFTFTIPFANSSSYFLTTYVQDAGVDATDGQLTINASSTVNVYKTFVNGAFTNSGVKTAYIPMFTVSI